MARRGRPPVDPTARLSVPLQVRLPAQQFDRLYQLASRHQLTMAEVTRRALRRVLREPEPPAKVT